MSEWSGRRVQAARALLTSRTAWPTPCPHCAKPVNKTDRWVLGHTLPRSIRPDLTWNPANWRVEHRACSDRSAQAVVIQKAKAEALAEHGINPTIFSGASSSEQPPLLPFPLPETSAKQVEVRTDLLWTNPDQITPSWLNCLAEVPSDASPPLYLTAPHPEAVGSYGPEAEEWAAETLGVSLRWWQRLSLYRALEHRQDGSLCWRTVLLSCPRRAGKSVLLYVVLMYRITHGFEPMTEVILTAGKLAQGKEIIRKGWRYADQTDGWTPRRANDSPEIETPEGNRFLLRPSESTAGYSPSLGVADEAWSIPPTHIDDDLNPSLLERVGGGQLWLVSTAHRRATSLMRSRILDALDRDDSKTLLVLWGAPEGADIADPEVHRAASPYITTDRLETLADTYQRALAGEDDPEFDDPDPLAGFSAQLLNMWQLRARAVVKGDPLIEPDDWASRTAEVPFAAPDAAGLEESNGVASLALSWRVDGKCVVAVSEYADLTSAAAALAESGFHGFATVGASLMEETALKGTRRRKASARAAQAVTDMRRLLAEDVVRHDGGEHLTTQMLAVRTSPTPDGIRILSKESTSAVKAATWAIADSRRIRRRTRNIVLPQAG